MTTPDAADPIVACHGLTKSYRTKATLVPALRGIDLEVHAGELLMLVGPSGCGKTTLISVMAGILDQDEGSCTVLGQELRALPPAGKTRFRQQHIGFVFQAFNLLPTLTAAENAAVPLLIAGKRRRDALRAAAELLERVGLGDRARSFPRELSGGQQQRVAVARALINRPRLLVCDEPTSALDHRTGETVMGLLRELARDRERALVIVTHDVRIFPFADRIAHLDDGRVVRIESPAPAPP